MNLFILSIAILELSSLLGCPDPIPIVDLFLTSTIALDFTKRQTLNANIKFSNCNLSGFFLETTRKSFLEKSLSSSDWMRIVSFAELNLGELFNENFDASINLNFFFCF